MNVHEMTVHDTAESLEFLGTVEGEIAFFRAIMRARPVGIHRHFHILNIRNGIQKDTSHAVTVQAVWDKLRDLYDMDTLEAIDAEAESYEARTSAHSTPISIRFPSPSENLAAHPFFREEYALPYDAKIEEMIAQRRMRDTPSPVSPSPSPQPVPAGRTTRAGRKRGKSKLDLAGLVGGDSDSSALTQESGDEGMLPPTPRDSVTITEGGTEYGGDEDTEMRDVSPDTGPTPPPGKGTRKKPPKKTGTGRGRGGAAASTSTRGRGTKRKK
ncbi:chromatin modification-related protein EAF7-domain-containing protein [Mycena filopes]|nr:chromatin modification-related protein EAF7-domain-containing protein [Mycena filopes]